MKLRRAGMCAGCGNQISPGDDGGWHSSTRTTWCSRCLSEPEPPGDSVAPEIPAQQVIDSGVPGASAAREYARRANAREQRVRAKHPRLGGLLLALAGEPQHQRAWATGSSGEKVIGGRLNDLISDSLLVLHDRKVRLENGRLGGGNIDHLVIAPSGVWVVDSKEYSGALEVRRSGGLFSPRVEQLWIAGRNRTKLVEGIIKQVGAVRRELATAEAPVSVHAALCFVGTDLPLFGSSKIGDIELVGRRGLRKLVQMPGPLRAEDLPALQAYLAGRFPPA